MFANSNQSSCEDTEKPIIVCKNGLTLPVVQIGDGGCVEIWASDFVESVTDDCTESINLTSSLKIRREGTEDKLSTGITFCCEDLGTQIIDVWVTDDSGKSDFCTTYVIVQDHLHPCGGDPASIQGCIQTIHGEYVTSSQIPVINKLIATPTGDSILWYPVTFNDGCFSSNVTFGDDYTIEAKLDEWHLNGVSGSDIYVALRHILGIEIIDNPYNLVAADVNNDKKIDVRDIMEIRKLILHKDDRFPNNTSWRFFDASKPLEENPFLQDTWPEKIEIKNLQNFISYANFVAVKIGDLTGDVTGKFTDTNIDNRTQGTLEFVVDDIQLVENQNQTIDFKAKDFKNVNGFQFTLNYDAEALSFIDVISGEVNLNESNFANLKDGVITFSWNEFNEAINLDDDAILFSVDFKAKPNDRLGDLITISSRYTQAESYFSGNVLKDLKLDINSIKNTFELFQNYPNPFEENTTIGFALPEASFVKFSVFNHIGQVIYSTATDYSKGNHEII